MENKCVMCYDDQKAAKWVTMEEFLSINKKTSELVAIKEWIIDGKTEAKEGEQLYIHSECLSDQLYIERPEGFVYGRLTLGKDEVKDEQK